MQRKVFGWVLGVGLMAIVGSALPACSAAAEEDLDFDDGEGTAESIDPLAVAGRWKLPSTVRSAGATMFVSYDYGPSWSPKLCAGGLKPGAKKLAAFLEQKFPSQIDHTEGYACRANTASPTKMSIHGTGRALDIFIPTSGGSADNTKGDAVANYLVQHAEELQIQYIIWDRTQWRANGANDRLYSGPHPHHDHLHVEITNEAANRTAAWYQ